MLHAAPTPPSPSGTYAVAGGRLRDYVLGERLDEGGMGEVWSAEHRPTRRSVALKLSKDPSRAGAARFVREARLARRCSHPNVIRVHELVRSREGVLGLAMEKLEGASLASLIAGSGALPLELVACTGTALASALAVVHAAGVLHRDIKPSNVFVTTSRHGCAIKLLDFGIAHDLASGCPLDFAGTPGYMAPEQTTGTVDLRADIWSFGVLLFESLTGARLFEGDDLASIMRATVETPIPSLTTSGVPLAVADLVARMLDRDLDARPDLATVHAVLSAYAASAPSHQDGRAFTEAPTLLDCAA